MTGDVQDDPAASKENFEQFFEQSLSGFVIADPKGRIIRSNQRLAAWIGMDTEALKGKRFSDLISIGGKIYYETTLWPLLRMQGYFDEVVVELYSASGQKLKVLINARESRDQQDRPEFIYYTISKATDRLLYEQNLQRSKSFAEDELVKEKETVALREQLIAVLGHDLRNSLSAISMVTDLLLESLPDTEYSSLLATLKRSGYRMTELITNIMDFARSRLGEGIVLNNQHSLLTPVLQHVIEEISIVFRKREIVAVFDIEEPIDCDTDRIAQLLSNLLANAITHGSPDKPVQVSATHRNHILSISVCNSGNPIPQELHERLFAPFTREGSHKSQNGLGLGLYISAEIARAHNGSLTCTSTAEETCFHFEMKTPG